MKTKTKQGDIWKLGDHLLGCGSATDTKFTDGLIGGGRIRILLTDPPYGVDYSEKNKFLNKIDKGNRNQHKIQGDGSADDYEGTVRAVLESVKGKLEPYNSFYIFDGGLNIEKLLRAIRESDFYYSQMVVWVKNNHVIGRKDYLPAHEMIAYGWHGRHKMERSKAQSVIYHPKPQQSAIHPTMKPVGLLRKLIQNSSKVGELVYDPFGGSGSTLIACEHLKRRCITVELEPIYAQRIIERWEKLTGRKAEKI
jgi:DNA modification methylase